MLLALGVPAASASAPKPKLWLIESGGPRQRVAPGTAALGFMTIEGCSRGQRATVTDNGRPSDLIAFGEPLELEEGCGSAKWAGKLSSVVAKPFGSNGLTMTAKGPIHVFVAPWCVYKLANPFTLQAENQTRAIGPVNGTLDEGASFGACSATRQVQVNLGIVEGGSGMVFGVEVVG